MTPPHGSSFFAPRHYLPLKISGFVSGDIRESLNKLRCGPVENFNVYGVIFAKKKTPEGEKCVLVVFRGDDLLPHSLLYTQIADFHDNDATPLREKARYIVI